MGIAVAVVIATSVATISEYKNETSFRKLQEEASRIKISVFRNGHISEVYINDIVVGDYVLLQPGDKVPADGVVNEGEIEVDQSVLTGESEPANKYAVLSDNASDQKYDLSNPHSVYRGFVVTDGEAVMTVDKVGEKSLYGRTVKEIESEERKTPLQIKLSALGDGISKFGYIGGTFIALAFLFKKVFMDNHFAINEISQYISQWQVFLHDAVTAVILAVIIIVVAVPEGLPMMIAIVLSLNMRKLLSAKVLVRKLLGIETSGSLNILFSDKTGTITRGQLQVVEFVPGGSMAEVFSVCKRDYKRFRNSAISDLASVHVSKNDAIKILQFCFSIAIVDSDLSDAEIQGMVKICEVLKCEPWLVDFVIKQNV